MPWILAAAAVSVAAIYFRLYPITLTPKGLSEMAAQLIVMNNFQSQIEQKVLSEYPTLSGNQQAQIRRAQLQNLQAENPKKFKRAVQLMAQRVLSEAGWIRPGAYLMEVDPYYYLTRVQHLLQTGRIADETRGDEYYNSRMLAPSGAWYSLDFHPYTGVWLYSLLLILYPQISLVTALSVVPVLLSVLCGVLFLLMGRFLFQFSPVAAFLGSLCLVLTPFFLKRSLYGWFDTDPYNILFPLIVLWGMGGALHNTSSARRRCGMMLAASLAMGIYALFWRGWILVYLTFLVSFILVLLGSRLFKIKTLSMTESLIHLGLGLGVPILSVYFFFGSLGVQNLFTKAQDLAATFLRPLPEIWPDVFLIVGELKPQSLTELMPHLGGSLFFGVSLFGLAVSLYSSLSQKNFNAFKNTLFVSVLLGIAVFASLKAERFSLFVVLPMACGLALGVDVFLRRFHRRVISLVVCGLTVPLLAWGAHDTAYLYRPIYNTTWDAAMTHLRQTTPQNGIVNTWWSPGHFITAMAERAVTFDGATQNTPQAYWMANFFLEADPKKAVGILRMLNTSGNAASQMLISKGWQVSEAVSLIHEILPLTRGDAHRLLQEQALDLDASRLLDLTHGQGDPPPSVVLIYNDMVEKALAMEYIGRWNFKKAEAFQRDFKKTPEKLKRFLKRGTRSHVLLKWVLSEGPWPQGEEASETERQGGLIRFANGLEVNMSDRSAFVRSDKWGVGTPASLFWLEEDRLRQKSLEASNLRISALIYQSPPSEAGSKPAYKSILADSRLLQSMLFRLYYLEGRGLSGFRPLFKNTSGFDQTTIYGYEVDWAVIPLPVE